MRWWRFIRAAWKMRGVYGWQDWTDPIDRAAMMKEAGP